MARRDDLTDIPRTKAWAKFCRESLGANSWYLVEKTLQPDAFDRDQKGQICHRGKWPDYAEGIHVPRKGLIRHVEELIPGSLGIINHPIWEFLGSPLDEAVKIIDQLLSKLTPSIQARLLHKSEMTPQRRKRITQQTLYFLETQVNLCGLAALAIIVLEASSTENKRLALQAGCSLFKLLLRFPIEGPAWFVLIAEDIFELLRQRVFPYAADRNCSIDLEGVDFPRLLHLVRLAHEYATVDKKHVSQNAFFSRLFDQPWRTQVGFLFISVPTRHQGTAIRAENSARVDSKQLIEHWEDEYSKVLQLETH